MSRKEADTGAAFPSACPWCKSKNVKAYVGMHHCWVECLSKNCMADGPMRKTRDAAIAAWNKGTLR